MPAFLLYGLPILGIGLALLTGWLLRLSRNQPLDKSDAD